MWSYASDEILRCVNLGSTTFLRLACGKVRLFQRNAYLKDMYFSEELRLKHEINEMIFVAVLCVPPKKIG